MQPSIQCLDCGAGFWTLEDYNRHQWHVHVGDLDRGPTIEMSGRRRSSLISDTVCPEPPRLDG